MTAQGRVSIITPSFNRAYIVGETAQSIFAQTYADWEWVIVDDGSTDNSWEVLQDFAKNDTRVKVYKRDREPKGACTCRNIAVERCTGEYVMFLDTDDILAPFCVEQRVGAMEENPECDFVIFPMLLFEKETDDLNILWNIDSEEDDLSRVLKNNPVCQGTGPLWKKNSFVAVGMWNEELKLWQDIELHIRSLLYPVKYKKRLDLQPDVYLRMSPDSLSRIGYQAPPKLKSRLLVYTYACETIVAKQLLTKYRDGLRAMGLDVILSAINGRLYNEVNDIISYSGKHDIFNESELKRIRQYMAAFKAKLYRIPVLFSPIEARVKKIVPHTVSTMSTVKWNNHINT